MAKKIPFSQKDLNNMFTQKGGDLYWKESYNAKLAGKKAGSPDKDGYTIIDIKGEKFKAHRLVSFMKNGSISEKNEVHHKNKNRTANNKGNLEEMSHAENMKHNKKDAFRYDVFDNLIADLSIPFVKTDEGFLKGRAIVSNVGIFRYRQADGTMLNELRTPEEVFDKASLDSFTNLPITNGHPSELVTSDNIKKYQVGYTGSDVYTDFGLAYSLDLIITDNATIEDIESGKKRALSGGYKADIEMESGMAFGNNKYDAVQRNIRGNHIAVVSNGRAGDLAKMELRNDSDDAVMCDENESTLDVVEDDNKNKGVNMALKKIMLDGVEYEAEGDVIKALNKAKKDAVEATESLEKLKKDDQEKFTKLEADRDNLKDELEKLKKDSESNKLSDADIQVLVDEKTELLKNAERAKVEVKDEWKNADIKKEIIKAISPKADLTEKTDAYIDARYEAVIERLDELEEEKKDENNKNNTKKIFQDKKNSDTNTEEGSVGKRWDEYCDELENAWKEEIEKGGK